MPDRAPAPTPLTVRGSRPILEHVSHFVFFLVVGAGIVRLTQLNTPLCWDIVILSGLLALAYAGGLALWDRLGPLGRHSWTPVLLLLWSGLVFLAPAPLTTAYVWCAVPLACAAMRALGLPAARARLRECGGDLDVGSAPGRGTRIRATVSARPRLQPVSPLTTATAS